MSYQRKKWCSTHDKKLSKLREMITSMTYFQPITFIKIIIHNFSSYVLTGQEEEALAYGLDDYIPGKLDKRRIEVEFELFYQNILPHTNHLQEGDKTILKSKFLNIFRHYSQIKHPYKYKEVISNLSKKKDICFFKQDKGRGIVIMDRCKYIEKCEDFLNEERFTKVKNDPTASFETRVQNLLCSMKDKFDQRTYNN